MDAVTELADVHFVTRPRRVTIAVTNLDAMPYRELFLGICVVTLPKPIAPITAIGNFDGLSTHPAFVVLDAEHTRQ